MGGRGVVKWGLSGWDYTDWRGRLYPKSPPAGFRALPLLAQFSDFMEVNVSFYRILPPGPALRWLEETPRQFGFVFKAWRGWTHDHASTEGEEVERFRELITPARRAGRLEGVLAQYPPSISTDEEALQKVLSLRAALEGIVPPHRFFAAFSHRNLYCERIFRRLEEERVGLVNVDLPPVGTLPQLGMVNTGPIAYLRLHGRNFSGWSRPASRNERYDHRYCEPELQELIEVLETLRDRCPSVLVGANNHFKAQAPVAIAQLRQRIEGNRVPVPQILRDRYPDLQHVTKPIRTEGDRSRGPTDRP